VVAADVAGTDVHHSSASVGEAGRCQAELRVAGLPAFVDQQVLALIHDDRRKAAERSNSQLRIMLRSDPDDEKRGIKWAVLAYPPKATAAKFGCPCDSCLQEYAETWNVRPPVVHAEYARAWFDGWTIKRIAGHEGAARIAMAKMAHEASKEPEYRFPR